MNQKLWTFKVLQKLDNFAVLLGPSGFQFYWMKKCLLYGLFLIGLFYTGKESTDRRCMIKIFRGDGAGVVTPSKPPPPTNNFCLYPPPVLRCFWKDLLMTPTPTTPLEASFTVTPLPIHHPSPPPKTFDHTQEKSLIFWVLWSEFVWTSNPNGLFSRFSPKGPAIPKIWHLKPCILAITNLQMFPVLLCWA